LQWIFTRFSTINAAKTKNLNFYKWLECISFLFDFVVSSEDWNGDNYYVLPTAAFGTQKELSKPKDDCNKSNRDVSNMIGKYMYIHVWFKFMVFNTTVNNISDISWRLVLLVEETRKPLG
jgi:hypothetical protein